MIPLRRLCLPLALTLAASGRLRHSEQNHSSNGAWLEREMIASHNEIRAQAGVPPLAWSKPLAARAQEWADHLLWERQFYHRPNSRFGENLFSVTGGRATPGEVVEDWASEARNYNPHANSCRGVCGHYTQLVWRNTKALGCAVARGGGREVWVCNYDPPGNWVGERPY